MSSHNLEENEKFLKLGFEKFILDLKMHEKGAIDLEISSLPLIRGIRELEKGITVDYKLSLGMSAETSGGLLIVLPPENLQKFRQLMADDEFWVIGRVVDGENKVKLKLDLEVTEV